MNKDTGLVESKEDIVDDELLLWYALDRFIKSRSAHVGL